MASFCMVNLMGNLGNDPVKKTVKDTTVTEINIAVNKPGRSREENLPPTWFRVSFWGNLGDRLEKAGAKKGTTLFVTGTLEVREYTKTNGEKGVSLEVRANEFQFAGGGNRQDEGSTTPSSPISEVESDDDLPF